MSYSSYEKDKKLMESWRSYTKSNLNEEQVQLNVVEEEQLNEELLTMAVFLKLGTYVMYFAIGQREKINKIVNNLAANDKIPQPVKVFFNKILENNSNGIF